MPTTSTRRTLNNKYPRIIPPADGSTPARGAITVGLDRGPEIDRPVEAAAVSEDTARDSEALMVVEKRTRGEAHADLRQAAESGWDRNFKFDAPREELALFRPERADRPTVPSPARSRC